MADVESEQIRKTFLFAMEQHRKGNLAQAEKAYFEVIDAAPNHADSIHRLGLIQFQRGNLVDAIAMYRRALALAPELDEAYNNLGVALEGEGNLREAQDAYEHALRLNPRSAKAHNNLGDVYRRQLRFLDAENGYREAIRLEPGNALACVNLGIALWSQGRIREAEKTFEHAIQLAPNYPDAYNNLGNFLADQGRMHEAEDAHLRAIKLDPKRPAFHSDLGLVLGYQGHGPEAENAFRQAIRLKPDFARAYWQLGTYHKYASTTHEDAKQILMLLNSSDIHETDAMYLHFAAGKIYDDCKQYDEAFLHYDAANRIRRKTTSFDAQQFTSFITRVIDTYSREFFAKRHINGETSEKPVFIVGMPRSGTTLVEQIGASHPDVLGAGELIVMRRMVEGFRDQAGSTELYPECIKDIDQDIATAMIGTYQAHSQRYAGKDILRILDKSTANFLHLGLIALLFPNARVIHCRRSPLDTCLSMYFHNFAGVTDAAYDLSDMGSYYRQYERLMMHWRSALPLRMLEVQYENLVSKIDEKARELIDFLDLTWDERCLTYYRTPRSISTSSSWQVRQPAYSTSVERWRNYERYLEPLKKSLGMSMDKDGK